MMNFKRLNALALVGVMAMGMAATPVMAHVDDKAVDSGKTGDVDVEYTVGTIDGSGDGKLVMVLPADVRLNKGKKTQTSNITIRMSDPSEDIPKDLTYEIQYKGYNYNKNWDSAVNQEPNGKWGAKSGKFDYLSDNVETDGTPTVMYKYQNLLDGKAFEFNRDQTDEEYHQTGTNLSDYRAFKPVTLGNDSFDKAWDFDDDTIYDAKDGWKLTFTKDKGRAIEHTFTSSTSGKDSDNKDEAFDSSVEMEKNEENGTVLKDILTFKLANVTGTGLAKAPTTDTP